MWARAFVDQVQNNLAVSEELEIARQELEDFLLANPRPDEREVNVLTEQLGAALEAVPGISPYVQLQITQEAELPTGRAGFPGRVFVCRLSRGSSGHGLGGLVHGA